LSANGDARRLRELTGVSKWFGHLRVLDHVDLTVDEHKVVCLMVHPDPASRHSCVA